MIERDDELVPVDSHAVRAQDGATAGSLARATGLPRATVTRTVQTLAHAGLVERGADGWMLGYELVRLARSATTIE